MIKVILMATIAVTPIADAVRFAERKVPVASALRTADWAKVPVGLRNKAQFSAAVESVRVLDRIQSGITDILSHRRNEQGALTERSGLIRDLMRLATKEGIRPAAGRGGLTDPGSERRLELIYQMQTSQAYGYADWLGGQDEDALDAAPAQELIRIRDANKPRDWRSRWIEAGGRLVGGRMVALKTDPIWVRISRFGTPWPPFDFGSGMGLEDILRPEAVRLGLIQPSQRLQTAKPAIDQAMEASVRGLNPELIRAMQRSFGEQMIVDGDTVRWRASA